MHVDSHWPPTYKAFVYLTDVPDPQHGPFSVVPGHTTGTRVMLVAYLYSPDVTPPRFQ